MTLRATSFARAAFVTEKPYAAISLEAQERHIRRKVIAFGVGEDVLVDFEKAIKLEDGDCLVLEDGRLIQIAASLEDLLEVRGADANHLARLAWHIGNRHLEAQIELARILIRPDHVIAKMLEQQGAVVTKTRETFSPEHGAYAHAH
ncbi:MAG: urease accessory protein UreE [Aestuariivirga sp.]